MKLLILTQKIDRTDPALGFFHEWIREFSEHFESVQVLALGVGSYELPKNVQVHSLGKEEGKGRFTYVERFFRHIISLRGEYDSVFVHMNPEYLVLGGWWWRLLRKRTVLWYTHRQVTILLRIATFFADYVATAAEESFRLSTEKRRVLGHGIDGKRFICGELSKAHTPLRIVSVARITPIKHLETIINAVAALIDAGVPARLSLVGMPTAAHDHEYKKGLEAQIRELGLESVVTWTGAVAYEKIPGIYFENDLSVNACPTGGIDKAVLESLASATPAFVCNSAFKHYLQPYQEALLYTFDDPEDLAAKIQTFLKSPDQEQIRTTLQKSIQQDASISAIVGKLTDLLSTSHA